MKASTVASRTLSSSSVLDDYNGVFPSSSSDDSDHESLLEDGRGSNQERDELLEVRMTAAKDTRRIRVWRLVVTAVLLATALTVTLVTFYFLKDEQEKNVENLFNQFTATVADAAVEHLRDIRDNYGSFANTLTAYTESNNITWPFFTLPLFESYARELLPKTRTEIFQVYPYVSKANAQAYLNYSKAGYKDWVAESHRLQGHKDRLNATGYHPYFTRASQGKILPDDVDRDFYFPSWLFSPPPISYGVINWNVYSSPTAAKSIDAMLRLSRAVLSEVRFYSISPGVAFTKGEHEKMHSKIPNSKVAHPHAFMRQPIRASVEDPNAEIVGFLAAGMALDAPMQDLLPPGIRGIIAVVKNSCNQSWTWEISGREAQFLGEGDLHKSEFDGLTRVADLSLYKDEEYLSVEGHCNYAMHLYPSEEFVKSIETNTPTVFAVVVAMTFVMVAAVFFVYDVFVQRRNEKLVANAARSNAIVSSVFPSNFRDRLIGANIDASTNNSVPNKREANLKAFMDAGKSKMDITLRHNNGGHQSSPSKPLADLFLDTTVMFADIVGFTAWSSVREPCQVFGLLETVYSNFDDIAKKRRVFKVETVGDCYVAATGMPEARRDHAVAMVRFGRDLMLHMNVLVKQLEVTFGLDTGDLNLRIGIHSGPVTAGVLRGERARLQLFGDTMNTAARIEATGQPGRIHISQETADVLKQSGKGHWLQRRQEKVTAKGKGSIQTYWLGSTCDQGSSVLESISGEVEIERLSEELENAEGAHAKTSRLVDWNVEILGTLLKQIIARRGPANNRRNSKMDYKETEIKTTVSFLDEVKEIITLPAFDNKAVQLEDAQNLDLPPNVVDQLRDYVTCIANMYRDNDFHNFEHASHVAMSVIKLLSRIVAPTEVHEFMPDGQNVAASLHDHTYGITSDPLTQFACAFSALIHDVDHFGMPNTQLVKENVEIAVVYKGRSVAEQNSLALAWNLLMEDRFQALRHVIYRSESEKQRFRQLVVNSVMATDIVDKELKKLRNHRWDKAFAEVEHSLTESETDNVNRKATIVIEHLIQASDVSHTMQHWHIYRKWNERFFRECYKGYKMGHADSDPSIGWYKGEIGFFDFYIIPLAKKLKDCGVFGKSSDEYLNYAMKNREEWEARGEEVVSEMIASVNAEEHNGRF